MNRVKQRQTWNKEKGYIWSMIGSAVGFANILSFSALCYRNGGGAFLIPYVIAHLIIGLPLLFLEGIVGQRTQLPLVSAMGSVAGIKGKMVGWLSILTCATIGGFYMVLTGFSVAYTYFSATHSLGLDTEVFFKEVFLCDSGSIEKIGGMAFHVLIPTLFVAVFTWMVLTRNVRSGIEKICSLFLPILAFLVTGLACAALFLPGAVQGLKYYLVPNFSRLLDWILWRDVFGQVFFSLSLGLGIVTGYSRHNPENFSIPRTMVKVIIGDFLISFVSGVAIFACIGFMSFKEQRPFSDLLSSASAFEIGFVIFPTILQQFGNIISRIIGPLFFFCVFIAGVTGLFSIIESIAGNVEIELNKNRKVAVRIAMGFVTILSIPFCLGNGQHIIGAIAPMVLGNVMLVGGIAEIILFLMMSRVIGNEPIWFSAKGRTYRYYSLKFIVLPLLAISLIGSLYQELTTDFGINSWIRWIWLALALIGGGMVALKKKPELVDHPTIF